MGPKGDPNHRGGGKGGPRPTRQRVGKTPPDSGESTPEGLGVDESGENKTQQRGSTMFSESVENMCSMWCVVPVITRPPGVC